MTAKSWRATRINPCKVYKQGEVLQDLLQEEFNRAYIALMDHLIDEEGFARKRYE